MRVLPALLAVLLSLPSLSSAQFRGRVVVPRGGGVAVPLPFLRVPGGTPGTSLSGPSLTATLTPALAPVSLSAPHLAPALLAPSLLAPAPAGAASPVALSAPGLVPAAAVSAPADAPKITGIPSVPEFGQPLDLGPVDEAVAAGGLPTVRIWQRLFGRADPDKAAALLAAAFDGRRSLRASDGSEFAPVPDALNGVRFVRVGLSPSPAASGRVVPGTEGKSGVVLLDAVNRAASAGQRQHEYGEASDYLFSTADNVTLGGVRGVVDAYSGVFIAGSSPDGRDYPEPGDRNHDGHVDEGMNVEHVWPQSRFGKRLPYRSDLHHLMATFIHPNGVRSNLPFGVVTRPTYRNDAGTKGDGVVFEPADFTKGRVARAMLYFYSRYRGENIHQAGGAAWWDRQIELMLDWNRRFPPDAGERRRNDLVEQWQGNRNPFVDDHLLADRIGADAFRPSGPRAARRGRGDAKGFRAGKRPDRRR